MTSAALFSAALLCLAMASFAHGAEHPAWKTFKSGFISSDGRVVDYYQAQASHSEGQGYAMLLAVAMDDRATFDTVWRWARSNLQVRGSDRLFAWKWGQRLPGKWQIIDFNNATDGDVLIAYALLRAADTWKRDDYRARALEIIRDIRSLLVVERHGRLCLLPGYYGFMPDDGVVLNPSYFVFPAFRRFAEADDSAFWNRLHKDSLEIVSSATFSRLSLPADWILWSTTCTVRDCKSTYFGYDAIRVLLYLSWDKRIRTLEGAGKMLDFIDRLGFVPRRVDLVQDSISLQDASAGMIAVYARVASERGESRRSWNLWEQARARLSRESEDYYSHVLYLLAEISVQP